MPTGREITAEKLRQGWFPRRVGRRILVLPETTSTNAFALEVAGRAPEPNADRPDEPGVDGLAVLAEYQTAGRGRHGRTWSSPRGASVLCSVVLLLKEPCPGDPQSDVGGWLTLASAVAACEAIRRATHVIPAIKWPNDLCVAGRKLGGILIESRLLDADTRAWVVGIGINCLQHEGHFPPELRELATSLEIEASHPIDRMAVARELLRHLDKLLTEPPLPGDDAVHAAWMNYAEPIGQRVRLLCRGSEYTGRMIAVDPSGGLIVQNDDGRREWFDPMLTTLL